MHFDTSCYLRMLFSKPGRQAKIAELLAKHAYALLKPQTHQLAQEHQQVKQLKVGPLASAAGQWRLYYAGRAEAGAWRGIGMAITDITNLEQLQGVRTAFKRTQPRSLD